MVLLGVTRHKFYEETANADLIHVEPIEIVFVYLMYFYTFQDICPTTTLPFYILIRVYKKQ